MHNAVALIFFSLVLAGQNKEVPPPVKPPAAAGPSSQNRKINPTAAAVFWRFRAMLLASRLAVIENEAKAEEALSGISCGEGFQVVTSDSALGLECRELPKKEPAAK